MKRRRSVTGAAGHGNCGLLMAIAPAASGSDLLMANTYDLAYFHRFLGLLLARSQALATTNS
jgi:hypothetical protein